MKLSDIMQDADLLVPNAFSLEQKVRMANQTQRQLFRDYPLGNTVYTFKVSQGIDSYSVPANCRIDQITDVYMDGREYRFTGPNKTPESYQLLNQKIILYPVPQKDMEGKLYYNASISDMTVNELENTPEFPEDYHELLIFGIAYRMAQRLQDYKLASELEVRFKSLALDAESKLTKPKAKRTRVIRPWL